MTATIDVPDKLYEQASKTARILGMNYGQLFIVAVEQYVKEHNVCDIVENSERNYISDLSASQISSMDKIWNTKEEDEVWAIL